MGSSLCQLISHTSTSAISSQNHISFSQRSLYHTNENPGPLDLYLCHGKLWQSPKVTEGMATAVGSCWWLLLLLGTCGIEEHAGDSASVARAAGHILFPDPTVSQKTTHGPNLTLVQAFPCPSGMHAMLFILLSSPSVPDHLQFPMLCSTTGLWDGMNYTFPHENMDTKSCLKEDYSDHWNNSCTIDRTKQLAEKKTQNI